VDIHALVDVEEESHEFGRAQLRDINFLKLADSPDIRLVLRTLDCDLDIEHLVAFLVGDDSIGVHLLDQGNQIIGDFVGLTRFFAPRPDQIVRPFVAKEGESVEVILTEESFSVHILNDVLFEHLLTDHKDFFLVTADPLSQPLQNLLSAAAHSVLAEPAILVVLHLNILVHDVGPFFQVLELIVFDLSLTTTTSIVVLGNFLSLTLRDAFLGVALLLRVDKIDNFEHLVLDVVLVDEGEDVILDGREVGHLRDRGTLVVIFV